MLECFNNTLKGISERGAFGSTKAHRNAERSNGVGEVLSSGLQAFNPAAIVPTKFAQTVISFYSLFRPDTNVSEKIIHLLQGTIAATQMGLAITLLFSGNDCSDTDDNICKAVLLTQLFYQGTLLVGWVPSEFAKEPYEEAVTTQDIPRDESENINAPSLEV